MAYVWCRFYFQVPWLTMLASCADYLDARPKGESKGTVVLVHGFPDISLAWRYQVPMLLDLGMRCIAIDCMGYGETVSFTLAR